MARPDVCHPPLPLSILRQRCKLPMSNADNLMNRRQFGARCAAGLLGPRLVTRTMERLPRRLERIGLELYSVRGAMRRDPDGTLARVAAIGYSDVELLWSFGNFGRTPREVRRVLDDTGLRAPSAHISPDLLTGDWARAIEDATLLGHEMLIAPGLPASARGKLDEWRRWAEVFNRAGAEARAAGIWLAFHNEPDHSVLVGAEVPLDVFLARTDPNVVRLQLDLGNMVMGGGDPAAYLRAYGSRIWSLHVKDVLPTRKADTGLGQGIVPLASLLALLPDINRKPCFVEQEGASDDLRAATADFAYLRALEF